MLSTLKNGFLPPASAPSLRRASRGLALAGWCAGALLLAACGTTYRSTLETWENNEKLPPTMSDLATGESLAPGEPILTLSATGSLTEERPFGPGVIAAGPIAIDVFNNKGGVEIRVDPTVSKISIVADVHVSGNVEEESREEVANSVVLWAHMDKAEVVDSGSAAGDTEAVLQATPTPTPFGPPPVLRVRAESPDPGNPNHDVNIKIRMPRCDGVRVQADGGNIILVNVSGAIQADNRKGAIELRTAHTIDSPVALTTDTGNVYFQAPPASSGRFELRSLDGYVTFSANMALKQVYLRNDLYRGVLNDGTNPIVLQSDSGNVRAWIRDDPVEFTRLFK